MNEQIEQQLRENAYRVEDAGDGIFLVLQYEPSGREQKDIVAAAQKYYSDVQWCPEPDCHGDDAFAVLNCFYPYAFAEGEREIMPGVRQVAEHTTRITFNCPHCDKRNDVERFPSDDVCISEKCHGCGNEVHLLVAGDHLEAYKPENCPAAAF